MAINAVSVFEAGISPNKFSPNGTRLLAVVIASAVIIAPALIYGVPSNMDLFNHFRFALPFYDALHGGHWYPAWLAESNSGYGDPSFRFYPPALYYLLALARGLTGGWYAGTLLTVTALSVLGGLGMYFWARSILPATNAVWAAVFYALAPYHVNQLYQAFLLAEYAGAAVLPFAFAFVVRICRHRRNRDVAGLAAAYALLILTHLPLAVIGSIAISLYALFCLDRNHLRETLKKLAVATALGLAASSIYWIKMITELGWIGLNKLAPDASVDYRFNFLFSTFSPDNMNVWWMNILTVLTFLLFVPALALLIRGVRRELGGYQLKPVVALAFVSLFMAVPLSYPLWKILPPLQQTQFPWRWLAIFSIAGSALAAATFPLWWPNTLRMRSPIRLLAFGAILVSVVFTLAHTVREAQYRNLQQFENDLQSVRGTSSVNYWIPVWASSTPRTMKVDVDAGMRFVTIDFWAAEHRRFEVAAGNAIDARVRTFYYPHWVATSQGHVLPTRPDRDGALLISLPADAVSVDLEFREPQKIRFANLLSAMSCLIIGALALPIFAKGEQ
jgi:hypothetical protein